MILPEPENSVWSSSASQASRRGRARSFFLQNGAAVPDVAHDVRAPFVGLIQRAFDELHRARVEIQLAVGKAQAQARRGLLALIDPITAKQKQMDAQGYVVQLDQKVFAPAAKGLNRLTNQPGLVELAVPLRTLDGLAGERGNFFAKDDDGRTFRHDVAASVRG